MNYIKEMNAFYVKIETNPLTASATVLWYTLMHVNNRARWIKQFSVAAAVLCLKSGLPNSTFKRARIELRDKGFIRYTSRGSQAPLYELISLVAESAEGEKVRQVENTDVRITEKEDVVKNNTIDIPVVAASAICQGLKEEKCEADLLSGADTLEMMREFLYGTDTNEKDGKVLAFETYSFYVDHLGEPPKYIGEELQKWAQVMGDQLLYEALVRMVESGNLSWNYTKGILKKWQQNRLYTVEEVLESEAKFRKKRGYGGTARVQTEEIIPDWFKEREKERVG